MDPVRLRNATAFSSELGHAHVLCDGAAYGLPAQSLNPYFLESEWDSEATADAAVPVQPAPDVGAPQRGSNPREDPFDSPLVAAAASHGFRHSLGLVRDWFRGIETRDGAWEGFAPPRWPQWSSGPAEAFGSDVAEPLENCPVHPQLVCHDNTACLSVPEGAEPSVCRMNAAGEEGVCMPEKACFEQVTGESCLYTCFMHAHCDEHGRLCSGRGLCEEAHVSVHNKMEVAAEVQLFAAGCEQSAWGLSHFEGVDDFATANGMCGSRRRCVRVCTLLRAPLANAARRCAVSADNHTGTVTWSGSASTSRRP